jgi:hypothetical protein
VLVDIVVKCLTGKKVDDVCERDVALIVVLPLLAKLVRGLEIDEGASDLSRRGPIAAL